VKVLASRSVDATSSWPQRPPCTGWRRSPGRRGDLDWRLRVNPRRVWRRARRRDRAAWRPGFRGSLGDVGLFMKVVALGAGSRGARFLLGLKARSYPRTGSRRGGRGHRERHERDHRRGQTRRRYSGCTACRICPDLDILHVHPGGGIDTQGGWGREGRPGRSGAELAAYGAERPGSGWATKDCGHPPDPAPGCCAPATALSAVTRRCCPLASPGVGCCRQRRSGGDARCDRQPGSKTRSTPSAGRRRPARSRHSLPGVVGTPPRRPKAHRSPRSAAEEAKPGRVSPRRYRRPTWCCSPRPTRWSASGRSCPCRASRRVARRAGPGVGSPPIVGGRRCAAWRRLPGRHRRGDHRQAVAAYGARSSPWPCFTGGWCTRRLPGRRRKGRGCAPSRAD